MSMEGLGMHMHLEDIKLTFGEGMFVIFGIWILLGMLLGVIALICTIWSMEREEKKKGRKENDD